MVFWDAVSPSLEHFAGELGHCGGFLLQYSLAIAHSPHAFPDDATELSFVLSVLREKALAWVETFFSLNCIDFYLKLSLRGPLIIICLRGLLLRVC